MKTRTNERRWPLLFFALACCAIAPACAIDPTFVAAARASQDAMAPEYLGYVEADGKLDKAQRERRRRTVARWDEAIRAREGKR